MSQVVYLGNTTEKLTRKFKLDFKRACDLAGVSNVKFISQGGVMNEFYQKSIRAFITSQKRKEEEEQDEEEKEEEEAGEGLWS